MTRLAGTSLTRVYDLYAPISIEMLASLTAEPGHAPDDQLVGWESLATDAVLETGSSFVCASETQRDYWLGRLEAAGRLTPAVYAADPSLRTLIEVVPFGIPSEPPRPGRALRGVVEGISEHDRVILWNGGIWNWFDPVTVIRGVAELGRRRDDVRLVFMGIKHPNPTIAQHARANEAMSCASELGVLDRIVFFNEGWVPYEERGASPRSRCRRLGSQRNPRVETRVSYEDPRLTLGGASRRRHGGRRLVGPRRAPRARSHRRGRRPLSVGSRPRRAFRRPSRIRGGPASIGRRAPGFRVGRDSQSARTAARADRRARSRTPAPAQVRGFIRRAAWHVRRAAARPAGGGG